MTLLPIVDIWEKVDESTLVMEAPKVLGNYDSLWGLGF